MFIAASIYWLFYEEVSFFWRLTQQDVINVLKLKLISASALTSLNYSERADMIILTVNASDNDWSAVLMQILKDSKWLKYIVRFKSDVWSSQKQMYDAEKREYQNVLLMLKKLWY